jgi:hypothetical protein
MLKRLAEVYSVAIWEATKQDNSWWKILELASLLANAVAHGIFERQGPESSAEAILAILFKLGYRRKPSGNGEHAALESGLIKAIEGDDHEAALRTLRLHLQPPKN